MPFNSRTMLLTLAGNDALKHLLMRNDLSKGFVRRFVAGETLADALLTARNLHANHIQTALDRLGENVQSAEEAASATSAYVTVVDAADLPDLYLSVKLTALGLDISDALAAENLKRLLRTAQKRPDAFVCVDMEGSAYTQKTLDIVRAAHQEFDNVGTVLQSSLYRTESDVPQMIAEGIRIRLVKGAYAEPPAVAFPRKAAVDAAYVRQMHQLLRHGVRPAIATHDEAIIREVKRFVRENKIRNDNFEFQMLLGIRRDLQEGLAQEGYHVRAYVPFGRAWYPYFMRRLAERPANIGFILRNIRG